MITLLHSILRTLWLALGWLLLAIGAAWAFGAIWFDFPIAALRHALAIVFLCGALAALVLVRPRWHAKLSLVIAISLIAAWWLTIRPSNTRDCQTYVAEVSYAEIDGDRVMIHNFRNFYYVTKTDFRPQWETKTVHLSNLRGVDFFTNYWGSTLICHTFLSFDFGSESPVCISTETRMMKGQAYSPIAGLYRQFALYYVIGDERDIVRLRTNYRLEDVYLYRLIAAIPERARALFLDYITTATKLHDRAQWYNEITSNCTTNVRGHIENIGSARPWDWQILVNGTVDNHAYDLGALDTSLPFPELKRRSHINDRARAADHDPDFSRRIREGLPGML